MGDICRCLYMMYHLSAHYFIEREGEFIRVTRREMRHLRGEIHAPHCSGAECGLAWRSYIWGRSAWFRGTNRMRPPKPVSPEQRSQVCEAIA